MLSIEAKTLTVICFTEISSLPVSIEHGIVSSIFVRIIALKPPEKVSKSLNWNSNLISLGQIISLYLATVTRRLEQFKMKSIYRSKPKGILPEGILLEMNVQLNNWAEKCFTNANETIKMVRMVHASQTSLSLSLVKSFFNFCQKFSWIWSRHLKWKSRFGLNTIRFKPKTFKNPPGKLNTLGLC